MSIFVQKRKKEKGEKIRGIIGYINKKKEKKKSLAEQLNS